MSNLPEQIRKLRDEKKLTIKKICEKLNISKYTFEYWYRNKKDWNAKRMRVFRSTVNGKIQTFVNRKERKQKPPEKTYTIKIENLRKQIWKRVKKMANAKTTTDKAGLATALLEKFTKEPFCYISGEKIDLTELHTWQIDHITPISKGGLNTIENLGLVSKMSNRFKHSLTLEELEILSRKFLEKRGFKVIA